MKTELLTTEAYNTVKVRSYYDFFDQMFHYYVEVESEKGSIVRPWSREILASKQAPNNEIHEFCFMIHYKVLKHIRKQLKKGTTRLLRKTKYRKLFDAQEGICYLCNDPLTIYDITVDHVVPKSRGGKDSMRNILLTHSRCNSEKGNRMPTKNELDYLEEVNEKVKQIQYMRIEGEYVRV